MSRDRRGDGIQEVVSSILIGSTNRFDPSADPKGSAFSFAGDPDRHQNGSDDQRASVAAGQPLFHSNLPRLSHIPIQAEAGSMQTFVHRSTTVACSAFRSPA